MNKPANCPICGKYPMVWSAEGYGFCVKIECCDHAIATPLDVVTKWNQYAAAMELAKATAKRKEKYDKEREAWIISDSANDEAEKELIAADREVNDASWRVLEVWNG